MVWLTIGIFLLGTTIAIVMIFKLSQKLSIRLDTAIQQVNDRLRETSLAMMDTHRTVGERLDSATRVFGDVQKSLGRLEETHRQIYEISKDISSLQELLRAPKFRGEVGETMLVKLLEDVLPPANFKLQHRFKSGDIADAVISIGRNLLPVDAKFPLENFKRISGSQSEEEKKAGYRVFLRDVKNRINEISSKYILPDEGTFDFALMYIPAEAVYYEISKEEELFSYGKSKKVIFVSPNTFYAYLQAILYGLKGIDIQRNIQVIIAELGRLQVDFNKFRDDFEMAGGHLSNAFKKYTEARNRLDNFADKLTSAAQHKQIESEKEPD